MSGYTHKAMDEVTLIYGKFVSVARQVPLVQTLLPVEAAAPATADSAADGLPLRECPKNTLTNPK